MTLTFQEPNFLKEKVLQENRRVHALENSLYLSRHPEQTNFFQTGILRKSLNRLCAHLRSPETRILDLGCGTGYLYLPLLERGYSMTGVDLSEEMIQALSQRVPRKAQSRSNLFAREVEEFVETEAANYDAIVLSALLHHLYDYESVVKKICKRLKPGGMLLIFFEPLRQRVDHPQRYRLHKRLARIDEAIYKLDMHFRKIPLFEDDYEFSDYQRQYGGIAPNRLASVLKAEGLEILEVEKYCSRRYGIPAFLSTRILRTENTFNLLARKAEPSPG